MLNALVAAAAERFRGSRYGSSYALRDVVRVARDVSEDLPQTDEVHGFLTLVAAPARLER